ncbi:MAG: hypothetical protein K2X27_05730 [Candidatus Obscuribacterales bacterium]|nr:hypothetical protein [Candidatus Obscuribacterales bacterium]
MATTTLLLNLMNNLFIPGLTDDQKATLQLASITFCEFSIGEEGGILIEEQLLESIMSLLNLKMKSRADSAFVGVGRLVLAAPEPLEAAEPVAVQAPLPKEPVAPELKELFADECSKAVARVLLLGISENEHDAELRRLNKLLSQKIRESRVCEDKLLRQNFSLETFGVEYDNLRLVPKIKNVTVSGGIINVYTDTLYARGLPGRYYEIGAFRIDLNPAGDGAPRWYNETRRVRGYKEGMHAPHIWSGGNACLGNTATSFLHLFKARHWHLAAALAIEFVESTNQSDPAGKCVGSWPAATEAVAKAARGIPQVVKDADYEKSRRAYMSACQSRLNEAVDEAKKELAALRSEIESLEAQIVYHSRAKEILSRRRTGRKIFSRAEILAELEQLQALPKVQSVTIGSGALNIHTQTLYASDDAGKHELGSFKITIHLDGLGDSLRFFNQTREVDALLAKQQAPHVLRSGRACLSDLKESFPELIGAMQFSVVAQMAIDFLEQANPDELTWQQLIKWPLAS